MKTRTMNPGEANQQMKYQDILELLNGSCVL